MKQRKLLLMTVIMTILLAAAAAADPQSRMEGEGFDTPREALAAYIRGLQNNDLDEMISAFSVETYAANYDLAKYVEWTRMYVPTMGFVPRLSDFAVRLNIETQRKNIMDIIRAHYMVLLGSPVVLGEQAGVPVQLTEDYASAQELLDDTFAASDEDILGSIRFENEFYSPALLSDYILNIANLRNLKRQADMINAQGISPLAASFTCGGKSYVLAMDAVQYGTKWYLSAIGLTANLLGIPSMQRGLSPMDMM